MQVPLPVILLLYLYRFSLAGETGAQAEALSWLLGGIGEDCLTVCALRGYECDEAAWPSTYEAWQAVATSTIGLSCRGEHPGGWKYNPAVCVEPGARWDMCYWLGDGQRCSGGQKEWQSSVARRICPCREMSSDRLAVFDSIEVLSLQGQFSSLELTRPPVKVPIASMAQAFPLLWWWQPNRAEVPRLASLRGNCEQRCAEGLTFGRIAVGPSWRAEQCPPCFAAESRQLAPTTPAVPLSLRLLPR
mmetsp:Transcript_44351/g.105007  ORF Transcript_44351/g.105007 Transcript_44351/m.105007 type:complete len:246 (+) Transcript_44351:70-807(+)